MTLDIVNRQDFRCHVQHRREKSRARISDNGSSTVPAASNSTSMIYDALRIVVLKLQTGKICAVDGLNIE